MKGAGVYQTGLAQILYDKMKTYGFEKEWTRMVERAFPPFAKMSSDGETFTLTVRQGTLCNRRKSHNTDTELKGNVKFLKYCQRHGLLYLIDKRLFDDNELDN